MDRKLLYKVLASHLEFIFFSSTTKGRPDRFSKGLEFSYQYKTFVECYHRFQARIYLWSTAFSRRRECCHQNRLVFLLYTLGKFGLAEKFIKWVMIIYTRPEAAVLINGLNSEYFNIHR